MTEETAQYIAIATPDPRPQAIKCPECDGWLSMVNVRYFGFTECECGHVVINEETKNDTIAQ